MNNIDASREFVPLGIALLTVSDTRTRAEDKSGDLLAQRIEGAGHVLAERRLVADSQPQIQAQLRAWIGAANVDVVIATGGTGVSGRDVTPEAFESVYEKSLPGFGELFRMLSYQSIGTATLLSRTTAGVAGGTLLFALPGSRGACQDGWDNILRWQLDRRSRPCNLAEMLPRLRES